MTSKAFLIYTLAAVWCGATAVKAAIMLVQGEPYVASWWDAAVAGGGRRLNRVRTLLKLLATLGVSTVCALALAKVIVQPLIIYLLLGLIVLTAVIEMSAPKPKRK